MKKRKKYIIIIVLIVLIFFLSMYGPSYAKYVYNSTQNYYLKSKGFYISSDYLSENGLKNVDNLWNGSNVYFNLKNSLNNEVVTSYDISYQVSCNTNIEGVTCNLNDTGLSTINGVLSSFSSCVNEKDNTDVSTYTKEQCEINGYKWKNQVANKELYFNIVSDTEVSDIEVEITATTTSPYKKVISGSFILHKNENIIEDVILEYNNYSKYDRLSIYNGLSTNKCLRVTFDSTKVRMDTTSSEFVNVEKDAYANVNGFTISIDSKSSKNIIFYRTDFNSNYDKSIFNVSSSDSCG